MSAEEIIPIIGRSRKANQLYSPKMVLSDAIENAIIRNDWTLHTLRLVVP